MRKASGLKIMAIILTVCFLMTVNIFPVMALNFSDISGYWAKDEILQLASMQIVGGYNGKFNPDSPVTRAEFAAMIVKAIGMSDQAQIVKGSLTGYNDVPSSHWASGFIIVAKEMGMISGYSDNTFRPSLLIRRDEITSILVRALNQNLTNNQEKLQAGFIDEKDIPAWALSSVKIAYKYKLIGGFPDGSFKPARSATRGETTVLVKKLLERLGAEFTFFGTVENVDYINKLIELDIHGQKESIYYRSDVVINSLEVGIRVFINVDNEGKINYIQEAGEEVRDAINPVISNSKVSAFKFPAPKDQSDKGKASIDSVIVAKPGWLQELITFVSVRGGQIDYIDSKAEYFVAKIPQEKFDEIKTSPLVEGITLDQKVRVDQQLGTNDEESNVTYLSNPGRSLNVTKEAINAPEFVNLTRSDGKNQIIAIIDTGVDVGHPDLQKASNEKRKIIDWQDFTGEGDIDTNSTAEVKEKTINLANGTYYIGNIVSSGGKVRYGYLREVDITNESGKYGYDVNFNGSTSDLFAVLLVDTIENGKYDTVYIDTDGDKDFSDEKPCRRFADSSDYTSFEGNNGKDRFNVVLTKINSDGSEINLGFDGTDHGTHVAGIAAANGKIKGVAPGAQIMALKVLDAAGYGNLSTIVRAMSYAAANGAKIINLSLGLPTSDGNGTSEPAKVLNNLTEKYGVVFVVAAGNSGPGINSVATPGDASAALSVGAFSTSDMWKTDYGWTVPNETLWFFSAAGPRKDGAVSPSVVAPGSVVSTIPLREGKQYYLNQGTSMAAPHVAGAVALLMEMLQRNKLAVSPVQIKRAIESGARTISGYTRAEQGYGALNLTRSWAELLSFKDNPQITVETDNPYVGKGAGIFLKIGIPEKLTVYLSNLSKKLSTLNFSSNSWIKCDQGTVNVPPGKTRAVDVTLTLPDMKGLYSSFLSGDDLGSYGKEADILTTIINPYIFSKEDMYKISIDDIESPAQYKRYFFQVPAGSTSIQALLKVSNGAGRARIFLFNPKGQLVSETTFAGVNPGGITEEVKISSNYPSAGVWEVIIYSSAGLSAYDLSKSEYNLQVSIEGNDLEKLQSYNRDLIIGVTPKLLIKGKDYITVQVREKYTKKPFEGFVEINGKICFSHRGRVTLPIDVINDKTEVVVKTVPDSKILKPFEFKYSFTMAK
jgi:tripeptidyl-peptidase-2